MPDMPASRDPILRPYIVASPLGAAGDLETAVSLERIDPHRLASEPFLDLVERIAEAIHPPGIFPRWAIYDCVEVPGGVIGLAVDARDASPTVRDALQIPTDYEGLVPVSVVSAVPMLEAHAWHVYALGGARRGRRRDARSRDRGPGHSNDGRHDGVELAGPGGARAARSARGAHGVDARDHGNPATLTYRIRRRRRSDPPENTAQLHFDRVQRR